MEREFKAGSDTGSLPAILSLSELAFMMRDLFQQVFPLPLWVKAEIAKINVHQQSGHCYLDLVEKQLTQTRAQFRGVIWANDYAEIAWKFTDVTHETLKAGMFVLFVARPVLHPVYGMSLQISDVEPSFTLGEMERQKQQTLIQLKNEGVFQKNKMVPFPPVPLRLAIISAETSKGYADLMNIIGHYPRRYRFTIQLFPALLQGDRAVDSIMLQLRNIEAQYDQFDLVMIIRGGGDEIGMTCFDNILLAREVCNHPLPVVTGIGHATNETVVEMAACRNKITPTDVAYDILSLLDVTNESLVSAEQKLYAFASGISEAGTRKLHEKAKDLAVRLHHRMLQENIRLGQKSVWLHKLSGGTLRKSQLAVDRIAETIRLKPSHLLTDVVKNLEGLEKQVALLDPLNVLMRGYSLTYREDGSLLRSIKDLTPGKTIISQVFDGSLSSTVNEVNPAKPEI